MEKSYILDNLDCANCAMKIEKRVAKVKGVQACSVDFVSKKMVVDMEEDCEALIQQQITALEPDVVLREVKQKQRTKTDRNLHEEGSCGCTHMHEVHYHTEDGDHTHHEDGCTHDHEEPHGKGDCDHTHTDACRHQEEQHTCGCTHTHEDAHAKEACGCGHTHKSGEHHHHAHEEGDTCGHGQEVSGHETKKILQGASKLYIRNLDCANCAMKIEQHVAGMDNVAAASLNFTSGTLFVKLVEEDDKDATLARIAAVIPTLEDGVTVEMDKPQAETAGYRSLFSLRQNLRLYSGILVFLLAVLLEVQPYAMWLFLLAYILAGGKVVYVSLRNILRGEVFDENFLMSVATIGALAIGSYEEAVAVMLFYEIGEMFQSYAVNRSRKSISSLMNIRADYANLLVEGKERKVDPEEVKVHDCIRIKPGERVPLDGVVLRGCSSLDTSALSGESMPRDVEEGDEVLAGVVNLSGVLDLEVTKEFGESTVSRILELVENASSKKAPMEKFITRFAKVYTPTVVFLAIALALLPLLFIPDAVFTDWLYRALTFLVVSCPCALVISVPLGMFAGIGAASKQGILIKGGNYLEALRHVDTVVFDKTGTLTKGVFALQNIEAVQGDQETVLELAAYGEAHSTHPIAQSIRQAYGKTIEEARIASYEEIAGNGTRIHMEGMDILVGNDKLMEANAIAYTKPKAVGTIVHVARNKEYLGYLLIADEIKETSKAAIQALKASGVKKCVMLSGDRQEAGEEVARKLGLDEVHMQLLPTDKVDKVEALLKQENEKGKLAFVGDGMNDAPVLARADVGVAMGGIGSDAAIEAADVVLMKDDPLALSNAIRIARKTMTILWQNIFFSLGIKIIILILTALGYANMWMGVFADVGVTLLAILNSMRALRVK